MKSVFTILIALILAFTGFAQTPGLLWYKYIDGILGAKKDRGNALVVDSQGNAFVTGIVYETDSKGDFTTAAYSTSGDEIWIDHYNGDNQERSEGADLVLFNDELIYATGIVSENEGDICLLKFNLNGNIWRKSYEPWFMASYYDEAKEIALDSEGNICVAGRIESIGGNMADTYTAKFDSDGNLIWGIDYSGASDADYASGLAVGPSDQIYTATSAFNFFGSLTQDIQTISYNSEGVQMWISNFTGTSAGSTDWSMDIAVDSNENTLICGSTDNAGSMDFAVRFQNSFGTPIWNFQKDGSSQLNDTCHFVAFHPNGVVCSGHVLQEINNQNIQSIYTALFDYDGNIIWEEYYTGPADLGAAVKEIKIDSNGNIFLCGWVENTSQQKNGLIVKYNNLGDLIYVIEHNSEFNEDDIFNDLELTTTGIYVTGQTFTTPNNSFMITAKYGLGNTLVADMNLIGEEMTISPNPSADHITLQTQALNETSFLFIYDVDGKLVMKEMIGQNGKHVDVSGIKAGLYTAVLCTDKKRKHARFLKI